MSAQRRGTSPTHVCSSSTCQLSEEGQEDAAKQERFKGKQWLKNLESLKYVTAASP